MRSDLGRGTGARQPRGGMVIGTYHRAVEVAVAIDLRRAEKPDVDAPGLQVITEHLRQWHDAGGRLRELTVADGERQHLGPRADGAGFIDEHDAGRVGETGEVAGG